MKRVALPRVMALRLRPVAATASRAARFMRSWM
jgi:hypothetical protein